MNESDLVLTFVDACCFTEKGLESRGSDLWKAYQQWSDESGLMKIRRSQFYERLFKYFRAEERPIRYQGLELKPYDLWDYYEPWEVRKIYLISNGTHVKIGLSQDPETRLKTLQTGSSFKLELLGWVDGDYDKETQLQDYFAHKSEEGEWFDLTRDEIMSTLAGIFPAGDEQ